MPLLPAHQRYRTVSLRTAVSVAGKRIFEVRDKEPERASKVQERRCRDKISLNGPADSGPIRRDLGNLRSAESAWWAREPSKIGSNHLKYRIGFRTLRKVAPNIAPKTADACSTTDNTAG